MQSNWQRLTVSEIQILFAPSKRFWCLAGGLAIDAFLGSETRPHGDVDIVIRRQDLAYFQKLLDGWLFYAAQPPDSLRKLDEVASLSASENAVWCKNVEQGSWQFEFLPSDFTSDE